MESIRKDISKIFELVQVLQSAEDPCINLCLKVFRLFGSLPTGRNQSAVASICRFFLPRLALYASVYGLFIGHPLLAYQSLGEDIHLVVETISGSLIALVMCTMFNCLLYRRDQLDRMFRAFEEMKERSLSLEKRPAHLIERNKVIYKIPMICLLLGVSTMQLSLLSIPQTLQKRNLLINHWYPFNVKASPVYEIVFCFAITAHVVAMNTVIAFHILFISLSVEADGQFSLLLHNLQGLCGAKHGHPNNVRGKDLHGNVDRIDNRTTTWNDRLFGDVVSHSHPKLVRRDLRMPMKACIELHYAILRFWKQVESTFNMYLFFMLTCSLVPGGLGILLVFYADDSDKIILYLVLTLGGNIGTALCFWLGNRLTDQNEAVRDAVYDCDWFDQSESFKRSMRIIMSRGNQPMVIKAGGFVELTMETYYKMTKLTYSYVMATWSFFK